MDGRVRRFAGTLSRRSGAKYSIGLVCLWPKLPQIACRFGSFEWQQSHEEAAVPHSEAKTMLGAHAGGMGEVAITGTSHIIEPRSA